MLSLREKNEIEHGRFLLRSRAEAVWGHDGIAGQRRVLRRISEFTRLGKLGPGRKILELGCGTGVFTAELLKTGAEIVALDLSPELLASAKSKISAANVSFIEGNAEKLSEFFSAGEFDAVVGNSMLHHLDEVKTLESVFNILAAGGSAVFSEPNMLNPQIALQKNIKWLKKAMGDSPDETAFFRWRVGSLLKKIGYTDIKVSPFDFLHPAVPDNLAPFMEKVGLLLEKLPVVREIAGSLLIYARKP